MSVIIFITVCIDRTGSASAGPSDALGACSGGRWEFGEDGTHHPRQPSYQPMYRMLAVIRNNNNPLPAPNTSRPSAEPSPG